ncbi:TraB/GumN family protein [Dyadobacter sp. CY326]|uniref:TraB/GumN family protein n=1 Tax=Dyadobacter sp. CY326 TaxID=2907300 RepID=UPI001F3664AA|nr:TraB/GumN family protein [Dyadobacter sp. CY326]MCE7068109.1 TraB/GumN family protein [Dyadobacter sp. CY326]
MKTLVLSVIIFCVSTFVANAQAPTENTLLWEVTSPGQAKPSFLFGTIHLICPADFSLSDSLKATLARTEQVALEIDMDDPNMMAGMMKTMNMSDGNELKKLLSEKDYARLGQFYKDSVGMGLAMFERVKPFVLMGPLFNAVLSCQPQSYEMALVQLAAKQKSEVIGIETLEEQMAIFDTIPYKEQLKMIMTMIDSLPQARKEFTNLVALYKSQKVNDLYSLMMQSDYGMEGNEEVMLFARNRNWVPRIKRIAAEKPTFFAVGAGHLGGDRGIISLLRKEGFKVRAVQ